MKENKEGGDVSEGAMGASKGGWGRRESKERNLAGSLCPPLRGRGGKVLKQSVSVSQILCLGRKPLRPSHFPPGLMISRAMVLPVVMTLKSFVNSFESWNT